MWRYYIILISGSEIVKGYYQFIKNERVSATKHLLVTYMGSLWEMNRKRDWLMRF